MNDVATYLAQTETAVRKLFEGIDSYMDILSPIRGTTFVSGEIDSAKAHAEYKEWAARNSAKLAASAKAQREFSQQSFALATLCGSVLQVAAKSIECYSENTSIPAHVEDLVGKSKSAIPFCIGREVKGVPIGLIIYAGRNQHTHYNERSLSKVNEAVFNRLAVIPSLPEFKDPAMDLENSMLDSYASNVTWLLGWRSYEQYESDIRSLLGN